jgi:hypothetical protein
MVIGKLGMVNMEIGFQWKFLSHGERVPLELNWESSIETISRELGN